MIFTTKSKPEPKHKEEPKPIERIYKTIAIEKKGIDNHYFGKENENNNIEEIKR